MNDPIAAITIITDPDYRQDPWREWLQQAVRCFDLVVIVCGREADILQVREFLAHLPDEPRGNVLIEYMEWPQPAWSFEELPRHLNRAIEIAKEHDPAWIIRLDCDTFIHENEMPLLRQKLHFMKRAGIPCATLEKYQFYSPTRAFEKGKVPLCLNADQPIRYGKIRGAYSDLCQPIMFQGAMIEQVHREDTSVYQLRFPIPEGPALSARRRVTTAVHAWNYDYTFKTEERARELLYHFDQAHAMFWGRGYSGLHIDEITPWTAFGDYIRMIRGRYGRALHLMKPSDHPAGIRPAIEALRPDQFGHSLWGMIST